MASDYCDLMRPGVQQFAYLRCPSKIRAALANAGGPRLSVEAVKRALTYLPTKVEGAHIGDPTDEDGEDFRVRMLVQPIVKNSPARALRMERRRIAALAALVPDRKEEEAPPPKPKLGRPPRGHFTPPQAFDLIERVCAELGVSEERFYARRRDGLAQAAASLVAVLLRERNPQAYSFKRLSHVFERNDHTTILHLVQSFGEYCQKHPQVAALYERLREGGK